MSDETVRSDGAWFDHARTVFLGELHAYLALGPEKADIKRQEIEATIIAIRGLQSLIVGE